jgi:hypothetical protein
MITVNHLIKYVKNDKAKTISVVNVAMKKNESKITMNHNKPCDY